MSAGIGLYLHFPWCVRKCPYCDFNSHPLRTSLDEDGYLAALTADLHEALASVGRGEVASVFCGGGTPSLFSADAFGTLLRRVGSCLADGAEVTMEANPGTVEHRDFAAYRRAGINRLSLGAQSFAADKLRVLGRIHQPDDTLRAFDKARAGGFDNINLDLMYGLPAQTPDQALADLRRAVALAPEHLSWYQLTIEPRTEFARRPPRLPAEDVIGAMEQGGLALLEDAGYRRYEISGFARADRQCRHNLNYWTFGDYLGVGAGAHGKRSQLHGDALRIERTSKPRQPRLYMADPIAAERRAVDGTERVFEFMMNALRLVDGCDFAVFEQRTGLGRQVLESQWRELAAQGLVSEDRLAATELGLRYLDTVLQRFLA